MKSDAFGVIYDYLKTLREMEAVENEHMAYMGRYEARLSKLQFTIQSDHDAIGAILKFNGIQQVQTSDTVLTMDEDGFIQVGPIPKIPHAINLVMPGSEAENSETMSVPEEIVA